MGGGLMAGTTKTTINFSLLNQVEYLLPMECGKSNNCLLELMRTLTSDKMKCNIMEKLRKGYEEMSQINEAIAEIGLEEDLKDLTLYEAKLKRRGML